MSRDSSGASPRAWVLNLDAELELMRPRNYQPTKGSLAACARFSAPAHKLLRPGDCEVERTKPCSPGYARGYQGTAWCPTPSVVALLERAGAPVEQPPSLGCLQTVNHRSFHARLGQTLPDAAFVANLQDALRHLTRPSPQGWIVKRGFGFAGRGVRRMPATLTSDDARWLTHALAYGGVQVEPWMSIVTEYSLHGFITRTTTTMGQPCRLLDANEPSYELVDSDSQNDDASLRPLERAALFQQAERTAHALQAEGYTGPFGIDAFAYRWQGMRVFNPRSEVNARYTLAYPVGMQRQEP